MRRRRLQAYATRRHSPLRPTPGIKACLARAAGSGTGFLLQPCSYLVASNLFNGPDHYAYTIIGPGPSNDVLSLGRPSR